MTNDRFFFHEKTIQTVFETGPKIVKTGTAINPLVTKLLIFSELLTWESENVHELDKKKLKERTVVPIDIANDPVNAADYKKKLSSGYAKTLIKTNKRV